jgi:hypothetical protein
MTVLLVVFTELLKRLPGAAGLVVVCLLAIALIPLLVLGWMIGWNWLHECLARVRRRRHAEERALREERFHEEPLQTAPLTVRSPPCRSKRWPPPPCAR